MQNDIEINGKVWFFSGGDIELEAQLRRCDDFTTMRVRYWKAGDSDAKYLTPDNVSYFRTDLGAFAQSFIQLGFDVVVKSHISVHDMRKKD